MTLTNTSKASGPDAPTGKHATANSGGFRSLAVTIGPSLILDALLGFSWVAALSSITRRIRALQVIAAVGAVGPWLYVLKVRPWVLHWGATDAEVSASLPGDEVIPEPAWQSTRAIDIAAPVESVWPWLAQMGQDRGGLYSYDWLENIAGLDFHNADRIVPEWQEVKVGDFVRFAPNQDTLIVIQVEPDQCLVWRLLQPGTDQPAGVSSGTVRVDATWAFVLRPVDAGHSRLIQRFRFGIQPRLLGVLYVALMEIPHFVMERRMLLGIRQRAEQP